MRNSENDLLEGSWPVQMVSHPVALHCTKQTSARSLWSSIQWGVSAMATHTFLYLLPSKDQVKRPKKWGAAFLAHILIQRKHLVWYHQTVHSLSLSGKSFNQQSEDRLVFLLTQSISLLLLMIKDNLIFFTQNTPYIPLPYLVVNKDVIFIMKYELLWLLLLWLFSLWCIHCKIMTFVYKVDNTYEKPAS